MSSDSRAADRSVEGRASSSRIVLSEATKPRTATGSSSQEATLRVPEWKLVTPAPWAPTARDPAPRRQWRMGTRFFRPRDVEPWLKMHFTPSVQKAGPSGAGFLVCSWGSVCCYQVPSFCTCWRTAAMSLSLMRLARFWKANLDRPSSVARVCRDCGFGAR